MKKTWRTINKILARHKQCNALPTRLQYKGETLTDPQRIADSFNEYFVTFEHYVKTPTNQSCNFEEVTDEDILTILYKLDNNIQNIQ